MGTIAEKLEYLNGTKDAIKTAIEGKGVSVPDGTTFRGYAALIASMTSGGTYQEKTATPTGEQFDVLPDAGYDALSKVTIAGDTALKPWNIPEGTTIYGVVGTAKLAVSTDPPADLPVTKGDADTVLTENDATADVSTFDLMVLAQDDGNITYCYLDKGNGKCLYNGVELPELPTLGVDIYPYAIISSNNYRLVTSSTKPESHGGSIADYGGTSIKVYNLKSDGSGWNLNTPYENQNNYKSTIESLSSVVWSSFDILDADSGEIVFAKTNPVPSGAFTITSYDPITTEFKAKGWRRLSYHTTGELAGTWTYDDFTDTESGGWNYLKNVRSCSREKLYYNGVEVWPGSSSNWSYNGTILPAYPKYWDHTKYPYGIIYGSPTDTSLYWLVTSENKIVSDGENISLNGKFYSGELNQNWVSNGIMNIEVSKSLLIWANHDVLETSGSIYLASSIPTPM